MKLFNKQVTIFFLLFFQYQIYCQSVNIDNIEISINDSLEQVIEKFKEPPYHLKVDTLKLSIRYNIFKELYDQQGNSNVTVRSIGYLYFFYLPQKVPFNYTKELYRIEKVWSNYYLNDIPSLLNIISNILEKNTIDKYSIELSQTKTVEPDYTSKTISIRINRFTILEIYFRDNNYFEINEVITEDENTFSKKEYILIFEDYKHYHSDKEYILEVFQKEDEAEVRRRELLINYLMDSSDLPETQIIRFYKDRFIK